MKGFRDPLPATRLAAAALYTYLVCDAAAAILRPALLFMDVPDNAIAGFTSVDALTILNILVFLGCVVLVGRWIYVTNANAHLFSEGMRISPGWAVGWYFVPLANLVKPYQAMKESWFASHYRNDWDAGEEPLEIRWWWLLWIVTNVLDYVGWRMANEGAGPLAIAAVELVAAALNVALCLILAGLMERLAATQVRAAQADTFA
jgi:hypothetical protein